MEVKETRDSWWNERITCATTQAEMGFENVEKANELVLLIGLRMGKLPTSTELRQLERSLF